MNDFPSTLSPDGHELWDWAGRMSQQIHRQCKINELRESIRGLDGKCGSCDKWMKSKECPKEKNVNGRNQGPSMNSIACSQFVESASTKHLRSKFETELKTYE